MAMTTPSLVANTPVFIGISGLRRASVRDLIAATEAWLAVPQALHLTARADEILEKSAAPVALGRITA